MSQTLCRWGILGTANIARKYWQAIHHAGNSALVAVASRDRARAQCFIEECTAAIPMRPAPLACNSYAELVERDDIDAVYLPLPTGIRKEWVLRAAEAGKHVLCEKPCGVTSQDVREMLDVCRARGVQFMDGVMFMHSRRLPLLRQVLDDPELIGTVLRVASHFSFKGTEDFWKQNIRVNNELEPLGCLGDLGWYNIRFSLWLMNERLPELVTGRILAEHARKEGDLPVPVEFSGELLFAGGASASFYCSFRTANQQTAIVSGTQGYLVVPDFVLPFHGSEVGFEVNRPEFRIQGCDFNMESQLRKFAVQEHSNSAADAQEANMIRAFAETVRSGKVEPRWGEIALKTQQVLDACLNSARDGGAAKTVLCA
jgi:predicted dehydrogenase